MNLELEGVNYYVYCWEEYSETGHYLQVVPLKLSAKNFHIIIIITEDTWRALKFFNF